MTRVLLITDSERVQRVFQALESEGVLQLRAVSTLAVSDELAESSPEYIFAQSRISGFSSEVALRRLSGELPPGARIVLLPVDEEDAARAKKQGKDFLSLAVYDHALAEGIRKILSAEPSPAPAPETAAEAEAEPAPPRKRQGARRKKDVAVAPEEPQAISAVEAVEQPVEQPVVEPVLDAEAAGPPVVKAARPRTRKKKAPPPAAPEEQETPSPLPPVQGPAEKEPVCPVLPQWITEELPADLPVQESSRVVVDELVVAVAGAEKEIETFAEIMQRVSASHDQEKGEAQLPEEPASQPATSSRPFQESDQFDKSQEPEKSQEPQEPQERSPVEEVQRPRGMPQGEPEILTNGMLRGEKRAPQWVIPVVLVLLLVPLMYLAAGLLREVRVEKKAENKPPPAPAPARAPQATPAKAPQAAPAKAPPAAVAGATAPAPATRAAPQAKPPPAPAARPVPAQVPAPAPPRAAAPPAKAGLRTLPPFMAGVPVDPAYARKHPGWQRYLGGRGEYKIFKEDGVYRALQVIALPGQSIPDEIYQRALLEFGGIDNYRVQSSEKRGSYLIEHGEAKGGITLTIYRKSKDLSMKGLVIYYR